MKLYALPYYTIQINFWITNLHNKRTEYLMKQIFIYYNQHYAHDWSG